MNRKSALTLLVALTSVAPAVHAQWSTIVRPPSAPTNLAPASGTYIGRATAPLTPLALSWEQYLTGGSGWTVNPLATHFIICFQPYSGATAPACTVSNADWTETITAPTPALTRAGNYVSFNPARLTPSQFIDPSELDRPMRLTLGACSQLVNSSCRFVGRDLYYSSMNIVAQSPSTSQSTATNWVFDVKASNPGTSAIPNFDGVQQIFEARYRGSPGRTCDTDVDSAAVRYDDDLFAIDQKGVQTRVPSLPRGADGNYSGSTPIVGVWRVTSASDLRPFDNSLLRLPAGAQSLNIAQVSFPISSGPVQKPYVVVSTFDTRNTVREFDENDNREARCIVR